MSPAAHSKSSPSLTPPAATTTNDDPQQLTCQWEACSFRCADGDQLYTHLCNAHVGRKSTNNLCLSCKWSGCGTSCAKRDHITSHLRVHIPLKPHNCDICNKSFKRPQDLKKHEKIHTEEHHAAHKHSKAITVGLNSQSPQPAATATARNGATRQASDMPLLNVDDFIRAGPSRSPSIAARHWSPPHVDARRSHSSSISEERNARLSQPRWEHIEPETRKRGLDVSDGANAAVDGFFRDMKKRKYAPSYDAQMADRLSALSSVAFADHRLSQNSPTFENGHHHGHHQNQHSRQHPTRDSRTMNMNPNLSLAALQANTSHPASAAALALSSLPLQALPGSPEELAIVNNFLVRLGEEIAAGNVGAAGAKNPTLGFGLSSGNASNADPYGYGPASNHPSLGSQSHHMQPNLIPSRHSLHNGYFDAATLAALGLINVPGVNGPGGQNNQLDFKNFFPELRKTHPSVNGDAQQGSSAGSLYGSAAAMAGLHAASQHHHRQQSQSQSQQHRHTPPEDVHYRHSPPNIVTPAASHQSAQSLSSSDSTTGSSTTGNLYPFGYLFSPTDSDPDNAGDAGVSSSPLVFGAESGSTMPRSPKPPATLEQQQQQHLNRMQRYGSLSPLPPPNQSSTAANENASSNGNGTSSRSNSTNNMFLGVSTKAPSYGLSVVPQLAPMDSQPGPKVAHHVLPLQSSRSQTDSDYAEESVELEPSVKSEDSDDDAIDGEELGSEMETDMEDGEMTPAVLPTTAFTVSHSCDNSDAAADFHFPTRNLPPPRPSTAPRLYPSISEESAPMSKDSSESSITLPSAASLISQADEIEAERAKTVTARTRTTTMEGRNMYPSIMSLTASTSMASTQPSSRPASRASTTSSRPKTSSSSITGHDEPVLPGLATLALNSRLAAGRQRLLSQSSSASSTSPSSTPRSLLERLQHVELIKAMLVWIK
ncbi:hypothetical protein FRB94_002552 [Tulasnella sp. JGI-2019a]|nr:hypothetical protein FRB94_002552 [Tulasnella sp. JGI-2019a]